MVARRWVWGAVAAVGVLWMLRSAHAQDETDEAPPWPYANPRAAQQPPAAAPSLPGAKPPRPAASAPAPVRRAGPGGYAAESARTATRLPREEREARAFLRTAAVITRVDLEASRLAAARAQDPALRAFAESVVQARSTSEAEVLHLLHGRGMAAPMMDNAQRKALVRLSRASGTKFDGEYLALVGPAAQRGEIALYERTAHDVADPVLKAWIERQLPALREQQAAGTRLQPREAQRPRTAGGRPTAVTRAGAGGRQRVE